MTLPPGLLLLVTLLLVSGAAWAQTTGIERYEYGDFEAAARLFEQELAEPQRPPASRALTRIYRPPPCMPWDRWRRLEGRWRNWRVSTPR
ncbi:hypothetical protein ACN28S_65640 [Cystobacter fuscus]